MEVVDDHPPLVGRGPRRRLLIAAPRTTLSTLLDDELVSVRPEMDREDVARLVAKYDLVSLPVVDEQNRLLGTISVDHVIDIMQEEASEDIFRISGSDPAQPWR